MYPNNKPWDTKDLKQELNNKKECMRNKDSKQLKEVQKEVRKSIYICKQNYKQKIENLFNKNDAKSAWSGLKTLVGYKKLFCLNQKHI